MTQLDRAIPLDSKRALAALAASNTLGMLALYMIPLVIGATADGFGEDEGTAGIVSAWQLAALAASSTGVAARFKRLDLRRWIWIGALAYLAGNCLSIWGVIEGRWLAFLVARGMVGAAEGVLFAVSAGLAAQTAQPDRTFSWIAGSHIVASALCYSALPAAMEWIGPAGAFLGLTAVGLLAAPCLAWTPAGKLTPEPPSSEASLPLRRTTLLLILSVGSLNLGLNMVFPFTERIGLSIGLSTADVGAILSWGAVLGILGPLMAGALSARTSRTLPLALGAASQIAGTLILVYATSHPIWAGGYVVSGIALMYFLPLLYGLVAFYDRSGQINAAAASVTAWASAAGPLLGGTALNADFDYPEIGWLTVICYAAMFAFAFRPARAADVEASRQRERDALKA